MKYRLRTLLIVLALGPPLIWLPVKIRQVREAYRRAQCDSSGLHDCVPRHIWQEP